MHSQEKLNYANIVSMVHKANDIPPGEKTPNSGDDIEAQPQTKGAPLLRAATAADWRVAKSLLVLRDQVNKMAPNRNKASDGTIGDASHQTHDSDHNPWVTDGNVGVVTALDITNDPKGGCDVNAIADTIIGSRDIRVKYIIWNKRITSSYPVGSRPAWEWGPYTGKNPHTKHVHISVKSDKPSDDSTVPWII